MDSSDSNGMFQHQQPSGNTNNHSPNNHRHHHHHHYHDEEAGGSPGSAKFGDYELSSGDPFDIPQTKNASLETLKRWRQAALVLNAFHGFHYPLDLKREEEREQRRRMIRSRAEVIRAAVLFKLAGENQIVIGPSATPSTPTGDYGIGLEQLVSITRDHNISALQEYGGVKGVSQLLKTNLEKGIAEDETDLIKRKNSFGSNTYPRKKGRSFLRFLWEAWQDLTLIILIVAAMVSLALGIKTEGVKEGLYDGGSIAFAVFLVIIVTAISDYRQSLQFQNLNDEKRNIKVEVIRGGRRVKISIFDIVVGDVVPLKIGDQVAADGIVITGHSLAIDESSTTGKSKIIHKDQKEPFLMSGCKVADGFGTMLVTGVGINTEWGLLMASISEDTGEETPLQVRLNGVATFIGIAGLSVAVFVLIILLVRYFTGHSKNPDGSTQYVRGVTSASKVVDGVIKIFTVAVTIVAVAVPEGLPLAVTLTLAYSMRKMMADTGLVRRLSACETMGSATTICRDKTGTLTLNQMTVVEAYVGKKNINPPDESSQLHPVVSSLLIEGIAQNTTGNVFVPKNGVGVEVSGSPTEKAILFWAVKLGMIFDLARSESMILQVFPFKSEKKRGGVAVKLVLSGDDDDLAKRNDIGESWRKNFTPPLAGAGIKSKDDVGYEVDNFEANGNLVMGDGDAGDSEDEYYKQVEQQTSRTSAGSSSPEPVDGNRQITNQMENSGSVWGQYGGATPDTDWDFDPTPHIGRTGGTTADGLPFSQASNSVEGQEASSSGHNGGSGAGSGSDESDRSTGSGGTDTNEGISRCGAGDEHDEDNRDEGNDEDRRRDGDLESRTGTRVRNSSNMRLVSIFTTITVQSTSAIIALSLDGLSPLARKLFTGVLVTNLVGFLCLYVTLFPSRYISPRAAEILVRVGGAAAAFGFLLMMGIKLSLGIIFPACVVILAASVLPFMP